MVASQVDLLDNVVAPPAEQWFWEELFERSETTRRSAVSARREPQSPVTLSWLVHKISTSSAKERRDRFEMFRFAQGVFGHVDGDRAVDALVALGGYRRYRAILLSLDRMDVTSPRVFARTVEAARRVERGAVGP